MSFKHTFKNIDVSEAVRTYAEEAFQKISPFLINTFNWHLTYTKSKNEFRIEVLVRNPHKQYRYSCNAENLYKAIDESCEKLERQFHKTREQLQNHKKFELSKEGKLLQLNPQLEYQGPKRQRKAA